MTPTTVSRAHPAIRAALAATFPAYRGRKIGRRATREEALATVCASHDCEGVEP